MGDTEELKIVSEVFKLCSNLKSNDIISVIKASPIGSDLVTPITNNIVISANKFIKSLSEQLIVFYCSINESIANKSQVSSAQNTEREERDKQRLKDFEILISAFYEEVSFELIRQLSTMRNGLTSVF